MHSYALSYIGTHIPSNLINSPPSVFFFWKLISRGVSAESTSKYSLFFLLFGLQTSALSWIFPTILRIFYYCWFFPKLIQTIKKDESILIVDFTQTPLGVSFRKKNWWWEICKMVANIYVNVQVWKTYDRKKEYFSL